MHQVYLKSFLNISATAATDGDKGLFYPRQPEYLWEDKINLNFTGTDSFSSITTAPHGMDDLTRCTLIDVSFWDKLVEEAPVNQRGWVLQERLMAPRVLHFCSNQIAWECAEFQDAEGHPEKDPTLKAKLGNVVDEPRLKSLTREDGLKLRELRLNGYPDPDENMQNIHIYEHWKRIVEVYSRTKLTVSRDKLIALSGIAQHFSKMTECDYVVGMWRKHLESQLLWRVNDVFKDGNFENPARRDPARAPSFSWAAIDSPHGIIYGEVTDYGNDRDRAEDLLFEVAQINIQTADNEKNFDLVLESQLLLKVRYLQQIKIRKLDPHIRVPYSWQLHSDCRESSPEYYNLYLDAPESDVDIFKDTSKLYCMPAAFGERTVKKSSRYPLCLLLKLEGTSSASDIEERRLFKRIGLAKLSNYADEVGQKP